FFHYLIFAVGYLTYLHILDCNKTHLFMLVQVELEQQLMQRKLEVLAIDGVDFNNAHMLWMIMGSCNRFLLHIAVKKEIKEATDKGEILWAVMLQRPDYMYLVFFLQLPIRQWQEYAIKRWTEIE
ncbi:hypothetical protein ACJX0J_016592, partial [Zea mays]